MRHKYEIQSAEMSSGLENTKVDVENDVAKYANTALPVVSNWTSSKRAKQAQATMTASIKTTNKNAQKMVSISAGFERDILEFHKYNDF